MRKSVLVTGGSGFIGSHIVDQLVHQGDEVIILDKTLHTENIDLEKVRCYQQDLCDIEKLSAVLFKHRPNTIHHCAGHTQLRTAITSPQRDAHDNINGTLSLIQVLLQLKNDHGYQPESIIFSSTAAVYGGYDTPPFDEDLCPAPTNPYGIAKLTAELYLKWFGRTAGIPTTIFRYANVYGPRQSTHGQAGVIASFMHALQHDKQLTVYGNGAHTRDYIFVKDIVDAHMLATKKNAQGTFNLGTGIPTSTLELAKLCASLQEGAAYVCAEAAVPEQSSSWMSVGQAQQHLEWKAKTSLAEGLKQTFAWYSARAHDS